MNARPAVSGTLAKREPEGSLLLYKKFSKKSKNLLTKPQTYDIIKVQKGKELILMKIKCYEIVVKATKEQKEIEGKNFKEACKANGYKPTECHLVYAHEK